MCGFLEMSYAVCSANRWGGADTGLLLLQMILHQAGGVLGRLLHRLALSFLSSSPGDRGWLSL